MRRILFALIFAFTLFFGDANGARAQYALGFEGGMSHRSGIPSWYASFGDDVWTAQVHAPFTIVQDPDLGTSVSLSGLFSSLGGVIVGLEILNDNYSPDSSGFPLTAYVLSPLFLANAQIHVNVARGMTDGNVTFLASPFVGHRTDYMIDYNATRLEQDNSGYWFLYTPMAGIRVVRGEPDDRGRGYRRGVGLSFGVQYPYRHRNGVSEWTGVEPFVSLRVLMLTPAE